MTAKEKAIDLIFRMWGDEDQTYDRTREINEDNYLAITDAISCAIICVDEILNNNNFFSANSETHKFWKEVLNELNQIISKIPE